MNIVLRSAVSAALVTGTLWGTQASALVPSDFTGPERTGNILRLSGATSTDASVLNLAGNRCGDNDGVGTTPSTQAVVFTSRAAAEGAQVALLCVGRAGSPLAGQRFGYLKESEAGSANGSVVVSATNLQQLDFLDVFNAGFTCRGDDDVAGNNTPGEFNPGAGINNPGTQTIGTGANAQQVPRYSNCTPQATFPAKAGISDVEVKLLGTDGGKATPSSQFQVIFGVPVSLNLYRALQIAQGITASTACDTAAEQDTPACVPSLPASTIASIYNGNINDWSQILDNSGNPITSISIPGGGTPTSTTVYMCRRGNTSGSQIAARSHFLAQGCGGSDTFALSTNGTCPNGPFGKGEENGNPYGSAVAIDCNHDGDLLDPGEGTVNFSNTIVFAGDGSGDVRNCLDDRDDQGRYAIGVLGIDSAVDGTAPFAAGGSGTLGNIGGNGGTARDALGAAGGEVFQREYRFIRVDGFLPDLATVADGGYTYYTENVAYARNDINAPSGTELTVFNELFGTTDGLSTATNIDNSACDNQPWGDGCILGIPLLGANFPSNAGVGGYTQAQMAANPVNSTTRSLSGVANNCSAPLSVQGGPASALFGPTP